MRKTGLVLALIGCCLLMLAVVETSAEACPSRWRRTREAKEAQLARATQTAQIAHQTALYRQKRACGFRLRQVVEGASGFGVGYSLVHIVALLRRRRDQDRS